MISFHSVKIGKVSELIAQQIRGAILDGVMKPGDKLPPERELVGRFQASRISVREALKNLESSGLVRIRPGSGAFVAELSSKPISDSLSYVLRMKKASLNDLTEARIILEPGIAKLACQKMTPEDHRTLERNIHEAMTMIHSRCSARPKNIEFHAILAESTGNAALALTLRTLLDVLAEMSLRILARSPENIEISRQSVEHHQNVLKACREKNPEKVYDLMLEHILQIQRGLKGAAQKKGV